jgi:type I restriction enzyme M protein
LRILPFRWISGGYEDAELDPYNRFHRGLPPKSKGDYAFISHMVETALEGEGKVGVIVPHGVLFRGSSEGMIRQKMIEENILEAVVGLPSNLFFGTGIPAAILIFNKGKNDNSVFFVDASHEFEDGKNQNKLRPQDIEKIVAAFKKRESVAKYAHLASLEEIKENDFNLNISRYVDTFEEEEEVDIKATQKEIEGLEEELSEVRKEMDKYLKELGL